MDKDNPFANLFYFKTLLRIGGTEQFLYEIAKKYHKYDITVMYDDGEIDQVLRLKKLVRCIQRDPKKTYYAKKAFYNFNLDALPQIEADEHIFVCHAIYQEIPLVPPLNYPKLTGYIGVSDYACSELKKYGEYQGVEINPKRVYNPLTLEKPDKVYHLISACRLDDKVKGGERTLRLIDALDRYCEKHGTHYIWTIYSNTPNVAINSPNVVVMKGRSDIRPYIADSDYLVQLSNDMESYCYSINEALGYGTRIIRTPLSVAKELHIPKEAEIVVDWDMKNVDEVAKQVFEYHYGFTYTPPEDGWNDILVKKKADYKFKDNGVIVQPICYYYDMEQGEHKNRFSEPFRVSAERAKLLYNLGYVKIMG